MRLGLWGSMISSCDSQQGFVPYPVGWRGQTCVGGCAKACEALVLET
jgi:hypothetical protein